MTARNMSELHTLLMKQINKAMTEVSAKDLATMRNKTEGFYTQGNPVMYERTGALRDTPRTTANTVGLNEVSFEAYLNTNYRYTTGRNPSMYDVLCVANNHKTNPANLRYPLGKQGFWDEALKEMNDNLNQVMRSFFQKA